MFLPVGDTPNPRGTSYVNYLLIAANVAVFLFVSLPLTLRRPDLNDPLLPEYLRTVGAHGILSAGEILQQMSAYDLFVFRHGFRPAEPSLSSLFGAMFLHGGWLHLAGNMLFLWIYGDNVEHRLGRLGYLLAYLGTGVAATLFFALFVPGSRIPMVGASGAISGVLGCYFLWFPRNQVKIFIFLFPFIMTTLLFPARLVLGIYLLIDNLLPFLLDHGGSGGVAHGAHIGGFVAGLGLAWSLDRLPHLRRGGRPGAEFTFEEVKEEAAPTGDLAQHLRRGEPRQAARRYFGLDRAGRRRQAAEDLLDVGDYLLQAGEHEAALTLFRRFIAERPAGEGLDRAYLGAGKALLHRPRSIVAAYQYFLAAVDLARSPDVAEEARLHLRAIERLGERR
jgi:membrane associated rhomboid family serine protease